MPNGSDGFDYLREGEAERVACEKRKGNKEKRKKTIKKIKKLIKSISNQLDDIE
jgi:hypothetical protein